MPVENCALVCGGIVYKLKVQGREKKTDPGPAILGLAGTGSIEEGVMLSVVTAVWELGLGWRFSLFRLFSLVDYLNNDLFLIDLEAF